MAQTSPFWTLPRELRDEIYAYAFDGLDARTGLIKPTTGFSSQHKKRSAIDPLLTNKTFFTEAAPYFARSHVFTFRSIAEMHLFLCGWTGLKAEYGQYIESITLSCSSTGGLSILTERCPRLRRLELRFSSLRNTWLQLKLQDRVMEPEAIVKLAGMGELSGLRGLESFSFRDEDLMVVKRHCSRCRPGYSFRDRYWVQSIWRLDGWLRGEVTRPKDGMVEIREMMEKV